MVFMGTLRSFLTRLLLLLGVCGRYRWCSLIIVTASTVAETRDAVESLTEAYAVALLAIVAFTVASFPDILL